MKSIKQILRFAILLICLSILSSVNSVKLLRQSLVANSTNNKNSTYISPIIDPNRKIKSNQQEFEKVSYVKQISPGGKAAIELQESGE